MAINIKGVFLLGHLLTLDLSQLVLQLGQIEIGDLLEFIQFFLSERLDVPDLDAEFLDTALESLVLVIQLPGLFHEDTENLALVEHHFQVVLVLFQGVRQLGILVAFLTVLL